MGKNKRWSYATGKKGKNRVRVFERRKAGRWYIEWWADGRRWQRSLKAFVGMPVTQRTDAVRFAHQLAERLETYGADAFISEIMEPHRREGVSRAVQERFILPEDELFAHRLPAKPLCGVYFLLDDQGSVVYIGRSVDILARITAHRREEIIDFARCAYQPFKSEDLVRAEGFYIHRFKPPYNVKIPDVRVDDEKLTWPEKPQADAVGSPPAGLQGEPR